MTKIGECGIIIHVVAGMVELADTSVLEADAERREGSSPFTRTTRLSLFKAIFLYLGDVMKYYEAYDKRYDKIHSLGLEWEKKDPSPIVKNIIQKYNIKKEQAILEIGCGEGRDARVLLEDGYNILASDVSQEVINYCTNKYNSDRFIKLDVVTENLNKKFDFIYSVAVIHMLVDNVDRLKFFEFINNHLKNNGIALVCSMGDGVETKCTNKEDAFNIVKREHNDNIVDVVATSCKMVDWNEFENEVINANLKILEKGIVEDTPGFNKMMYIVIKKNG